MSAALVGQSVPELDLLRILDDRGLRIAVLGASKDLNAKLTLLVLPSDAGRTGYVIKVPTTAIAAAAVAHERRLLGALHRLGSPTVDTTAPWELGSVGAGHEALAMSLVPGTSMSTLYHRWRHAGSRRHVAADLAAVARWLSRLQEETEGDTAPVEMDGGVTDRLVERYGTGVDVQRVVRRVATACARLRRHRSPRTVVHGDLWFGNVLVEGGAVSGVVDWEEAELSGEPLRDLARFALTYALYLDRHTRPGRFVSGHAGLRAGLWGAGIQHLLCDDGWVCELLGAFVRLGMRRLGVPGSLWKEAVIAGTAEVAARTDHDGFGRAHVDLLIRVVSTGEVGGGE